MAEQAQPRGRLSLLDCIAIGINGIVGSGIFLLPGKMAAAAGPSSILAFVACGLVFLLVALCFGEAASRFDRSGGAFLYARTALGDGVGFVIGWMSLCEGVIGYAAVSRGLASQVGALWPTLAGPWGQASFAGGFILFLGAVNIAGLKKGAHTSDVLSIVKLLPLGVLLAVGLWHFQPAKLTPFWPATGHQGFSAAVFLAVFACSGWEYTAVPAGEARDPRRDVPRAMMGALAGAVALYALVQLALVGSANISGSEQPLADAASQLIGPFGAKAIAIAGTVSMAGFCASSALVGPRLIVAFAEDGLLPTSIGRMSAKLGTPIRAIALGAGSSALVAFALPFEDLVDVGNVALFAQYLPTCVAVMVLRRTRPDLPMGFRVPMGDLVAVLAIVASIALLWVGSPGRDEWRRSAELLVAGLVYYAGRRWWLARKPAAA